MRALVPGPLEKSAADHFFEPIPEGAINPEIFIRTFTTTRQGQKAYELCLSYEQPSADMPARRVVIAAPHVYTSSVVSTIARAQAGLLGAKYSPLGAAAAEEAIQ